MYLYKKYSFFINILLAYLLVIFVIFKLSFIWIIALITLLFVVISILFYRYDKQKHSYDDTSLYKRVDIALYKAKETGRNKVALG